MKLRALVACWLGLLGVAPVARVPLAEAAQPGTVTALYDFTGGSDGKEPAGGVISDSSGTLYGETAFGGAATCTLEPYPYLGCGTLYSFSATAGLKVLVSFNGPNGAEGNNGLTLVRSTLYGSTSYGGVNGQGVLFSVQTNGTGYTLLHQFNGTDGSAPTSFLRPGLDGVLYGVTAYGGTGYPTKNNGVLFSITPDGTYTILHAFTGGADGGGPSVLLMSSSGILVGNTYYGGSISHNCPSGCGVIFSYVPATGKFSVVDNLIDGPEGVIPQFGSIGPGLTLYGNAGLLFSLSPKGGLDTLGHFGFYQAGEVYSGPLLAPDGSLIGVNGPGSGGGDILYRAKNGITTTLAYFGGGPAGSDPAAQPILTPAGDIIGTTLYDGSPTCGCGAIWEYVPSP